MQGLDIKQHMQDIPQNCDPAPIIRIYVDLNLQTLHKAGVISGPVPLLQGSDLPSANDSMQNAELGNSASLGGMHVLGGPSGQLAQPVPENRPPRSASGAVGTPPISPAGSMNSPASQASLTVH